MLRCNDIKKYLQLLLQITFLRTLSHVTCTSTPYNLYLNSNHQYTCIILIILLPSRNYCAPSVSLRYVKRIVISYLFPQKCIQIEIASDKFRDPLLRKMSSWTFAITSWESMYMLYLKSWNSSQKSTREKNIYSILIR